MDIAGLFLLAAFALGGTAAPPAAVVHGPQSIPVVHAHLIVQAQYERTMAAEVNAERSQHGLAPLEFDPQLVAVAREHARDMLDRAYFDHVTPDGRTPADRLTAAGIRWHASAENISYQWHSAGPGSDTVDDERRAQDGLWNSPHHRANMLDARFHRVGIGAISTSVYGTAFVQVFSD